MLYVDNDPIVIVHAQALYTSGPQGAVAVLPADVRHAKELLEHPVLRDTVDLGRPVALSLTAILHLIADEDGVRQIVEIFKAALAPGSALVLSHPTADLNPTALNAASRCFRTAGITVHLRRRTQVERFFDGWTLVKPGLQPTYQWRLDRLGNIDDTETSCYAGVALKINRPRTRKSRHGHN